jgi:mRNA interferase RelE/StbE
VERHKIEFTKNALKSYKKLPKEYKTLIDLSLSKLSEDLPVDIIPIKGEKDIYRIRVGKYRILFIKIRDTLLIVKIGTRGDFY